MSPSAGVGEGSASRPSIEPLSLSSYKVQFTADEVLREKLERLQALLPAADLAAVIDRAVTETLARLEARRLARTARPRGRTAADCATSAAPKGRHIPAAVRRAVFKRDGSQCRFVDGAGRRCSDRHRLQFHHRIPYACGGGHSVENLALACRTHNRLLAEADYGTASIAERANRFRDRVATAGGLSAP